VKSAFLPNVVYLRTKRIPFESIQTNERYFFPILRVVHGLNLKEKKKLFELGGKPVSRSYKTILDTSSASNSKAFIGKFNSNFIVG